MENLDCLLGKIITQYVKELLYILCRYILMMCNNISTVIAGNEQGPPHIFTAYMSIAAGYLSSPVCILYII